MKKKNGFTLIELLAVVVILSVIALISVPLIMGIINDAKKGAFKNTAYGILEASKYTYTNEMMQTNDTKSMTFTYVNGVEVTNPIGKTLNYKGTRPTAGSIIVNGEGQMAVAIHDGQFCAEKSFSDTEATVSTKTEAECLATLGADTSGASAPEISGDMIPIKWDGFKWIKAATNSTPGAVQWYNYSAQQWANVALVNASTRATYKTAAVGTVVNEADVMAYLVWVPRYKYKLFNVASLAISAQKIDVTFENKTTTKSNGSTNGAYLTHPAFTFGTKELNGYWVGKFETTGNATTPTIKPNVQSLTNQAIKDQFITSQIFNTTTTYGLAVANDAHMAKNTEWGAVAYLSQSDYGKYGNPIYTNVTGLEKEVYMNNVNSGVGATNGPSITGCAANSVSEGAIVRTTCPSNNQYHTIQGVKASATGNVYGVYDMAGGSFDHVMGGMYNIDGSTIMPSSSGFVTEINEQNYVKYIDKYAYGTTCGVFCSGDITAYSRKILGDATGETRAWNSDYDRMVATVSANSWFRRGGSYLSSSSAGAFSTIAFTGAATMNASFRTIILGE